MSQSESCSFSFSLSTGQDWGDSRVLVVYSLDEGPRRAEKEPLQTNEKRTKSEESTNPPVLPGRIEATLSLSSSLLSLFPAILSFIPVFLPTTRVSLGAFHSLHSTLYTEPFSLPLSCLSSSENSSLSPLLCVGNLRLPSSPFLSHLQLLSLVTSAGYRIIIILISSIITCLRSVSSLHHEPNFSDIVNCTSPLDYHSLLFERVVRRRKTFKRSSCY